MASYEQVDPTENNQDGGESLPNNSLKDSLLLSSWRATPIAARGSIVRNEMAKRENTYTDFSRFRIFLGTYNVNGQPPTSKLADWLSVDGEPPDIYAVGFQEIVDLNIEAFLSKETPREDEWLTAVLLGLHPEGKYRILKITRLVGIMLIVLIQERHFSYVRGLSSEIIKTGFFGKIGNKGAVAVRFDLHNSSLCFVNCHLAAHVGEVERRNQDYLDISNRLIFTSTSPTKAIEDHDQVFWMGDLNYRLASDQIDIIRVKELLEENDLASLLQYDQLHAQQAARKIFVDYFEAPITFRPTYKYDPGTDNWDTSGKNRAPAWCDRCLWKGDHISVGEYKSHPVLRESDHKPVSARLESGIKIIDRVRYRRIYDEVMMKQDKLENEFLPAVSVDSKSIAFGAVSFNELVSRTLTVANTGQVPVNFEFIKKDREASFSKPWLSADPPRSFLMPGEIAYITLQVLVDQKTAWSFNSGIDELDDILVLHVDGGNDFFITVSGQYVGTRQQSKVAEPANPEEEV